MDRSTIKLQDSHDRINEHMTKYSQKVQYPRTKDTLDFRSLNSKNYIPYDYQNTKNIKDLHNKYNKYRKDRTRDFESQIVT